MTTFDLANSPNPPLWESVLAESFPREDAEIVTILGRRAVPERREPRPAAPVRTDDRLDSWTESLPESLRRLGGNHRVIVEWSIDPQSPTPPAMLTELERARAEGVVLDYALRRSPGEPRPGELRAIPAGLESVDLSLLRTEVLGRSDPTAAAEGAPGWIARDVFSGGLLDGSVRIGGGPGPRSAPQPLGDLRARFEPVLALGFLTERGDRTLAQAALQFALRWPRVVTASIPMPPIGRFEEILGYARAPALTAAELSRLAVGRGLASGRPAVRVEAAGER